MLKPASPRILVPGGILQGPTLLWVGGRWGEWGLTLGRGRAGREWWQVGITRTEQEQGRCGSGTGNKSQAAATGLRVHGARQKVRKLN